MGTLSEGGAFFVPGNGGSASHLLLLLHGSGERKLETLGYVVSQPVAGEVATTVSICEL